MTSQEKGEYRGITWESYDELYFLYWIYELKDKEYVNSIQRAQSFHLSKGLSSQYLEQLKTKTKEHTQKILEEHIYTPEFLIVWNQKAVEEKIIWQLPSVPKYEKQIIAQKHFDQTIPVWWSYIEVKPVWDHQNMTRLFRLNQKWVWEKHEIFVNLIFPKRLFQATFTPNDYLYTEKKRDKRSIEWNILTVDEFLNLKRREHDM